MRILSYLLPRLGNVLLQSVDTNTLISQDDIKHQIDVSFRVVRDTFYQRSLYTDGVKLKETF